MSGSQVPSSRLLLVEGESDKRFLRCMLGYLGIGGQVDVKSYHGKNNIGHALEVLRQSGAFRRGLVRSVGVTRDADKKGRLPARQSLHGALYRAGLTRSESDPRSCISSLSVSTHIICDSDGRGRLEEMILEAVAHYPLMHYIDSRMMVMRGAQNGYWDEGKTRLGLYLNHQSFRHHNAIYNGLNLAHPVYDNLKGFLLAL